MKEKPDPEVILDTEGLAPAAATGLKFEPLTAYLRRHEAAVEPVPIVAFTQIVANGMGGLFALDTHGSVWSYGPRSSPGFNTLSYSQYMDGAHTTYVWKRLPVPDGP